MASFLSQKGSSLCGIVERHVVLRQVPVAVEVENGVVATTVRIKFNDCEQGNRNSMNTCMND